MAAEDLASIYQELITNNLPYCCVCFKTEEERRLVQPSWLGAIHSVFKSPMPKSKIVCYVCESQLRHALHALHALSFAAVVERWFRQFAVTKLKYIEQIPEHITSVTKKMRFGDDQSLDSYWSALKTRTQLAQTEVLLIETDGVVQVPDRETFHLLPSPPPPSPSPVHSPSPKYDPELETEVVIDDDDEPATNIPTLVSMARLLDSADPHLVALVPNEMQLMARDPTDTNNFIIHPLGFTKMGEIYVPKYKAIIKDDILIHFPHEEYVLPDYEEYNEVFEMKLDDELPKPKRKKTHHREERTRKNEAATDRVDWEDKIPMGVISFADAIDPNAASQLAASSSDQDSETETCDDDHQM